MTALGFVGLGSMGAPMATNLVAAGFDVVAFDAAGTSERLPDGASAAGDVADVAARTETMFLSLPDGAATMAVAGGVVAASPLRVTTIVDLSTVGPATAVQAAALLSNVDVNYVDAPVSGGVAGARQRTISLMFSGPPSIGDRLRPIFEALAGHVFQVGTQPGQGQVMKLVNNFLSATALASTSEAIALGTAHGLDMTVMIDVLNASTGRNSATVDKFPNRVMTGTYDAGFRTALMAKDMRLYLDAVGDTSTPSDVARTVSDLWQQTDDAMPGSDFTRIWTFIRGRES
jgi:3-hydroxyisobutyrate dehydrogenase-like beta-hydroxyacid dehydrogenase